MKRNLFLLSNIRNLWKSLHSTTDMPIKLNSVDYDFSVNGIFYKITSFSELTCSVASIDNSNCSDVLTIPDTVEYKEKILEVTMVGSLAFKNCKDLSAIVMGDNIISIEDMAFKGCSNLALVIMGKNIVSVGTNAFEGCTGLTSITLGENITSIEDYTFRGCVRLSSITIENNISIASNALKGCNGLKSITFGRDVTYIEDLSIFLNESFELTEINSLNSIAPEIPYYLGFNNKVYLGTVLNVPIGSLESYKKAEIWKNFWKIVEKDFD